jgi:ribonuclease R
MSTDPSRISSSNQPSTAQPSTADAPLPHGVVAGRLDLHRDGFGFVRPTGESTRDRDVFIPPTMLAGAMQGDRVLVELDPPRRNQDPNRRSGRILSVTSRHNATVVGIFHYADEAPSPHSRRRQVSTTGVSRRPITSYSSAGQPSPSRYSGGSFDYGHPHIPRGFHYVTPLDERISQPVLIAPGSELPPPAAASPHRTLGDEALRTFTVSPDTDLEGLAVNVEVTTFPSNTRPARGHVIEVLGPPDAFGVDVEIIIRKHHLPHVFPDAVLDEARRVAEFAVIPTGVGSHQRSHAVEKSNVAPDPSGVISTGVHSRQRGDTVEKSASSFDPPSVTRRDFRHLPIVTIDGETARDFDDAILVRPLPHGHTELQVHIADVSHYVLPDSALDAEARERGTSVYFPDRAIPMLPHELSSGACSLRPFEDRFVLSAIMHFDENCNRIGYEITHGVIRSAARMTYTRVAAILDGDPALRAEYMPLVPDFERMLDFAKRLNRFRSQRGSIDFDLPEPSISFDELGQMESIVRSERNWAHRLIEEFMLAANECVAHHLETAGVPSLYRIHEKPDPAKIMDFEDAAAAFGYSLSVGNIPVRRFELKADHNARRGNFQRRSRSSRSGSRDRNPGRDRNEDARDSHRSRAIEIPDDIEVTPQMYQKLAAKIAGQPEERILSLLMLRSLKQARYSEKNEGHFALASDAYTHFTSPIRRYPDLIVHRILTALLTEHGPIVVTEKPGHKKSAAHEKHSPRKSASHKAPSHHAPLRRNEKAAAHSRRHKSRKEKSAPENPAIPPGKKKGVISTGVHSRQRGDAMEKSASGVIPTEVTARQRDHAAEGPAVALDPTGVISTGVTARQRDHAVEKSASSFDFPAARKHAPLSAADLAAIAQSSSEAERHADDAERELIEWKKMRFMEDRVGDEFDALIISATKHGLFIELQDLFIEGLIPLAALSDLGERFLYREATRQLIGEDSGRRFAIGDRVRVLLDRIQRTERRLLFALLDQDALPQPLKHSPHPKSKRRRR